MLGLVLGLLSALLGPTRTRSPMFDRLQRRNNSHGLYFVVLWRLVCRRMVSINHVAATSIIEMSSIDAVCCYAQWRIQDFCKGGAAAGAFGVPQAPSCPLSLRSLRKFRGS